MTTTRKKRTTKAEKEAARREHRLADAAQTALACIAHGRPMEALRVAAGVPAAMSEEMVSVLASANPYRAPDARVCRTWVSVALRDTLRDLRDVMRRMGVSEEPTS